MKAKFLLVFTSCLTCLQAYAQVSVSYASATSAVATLKGSNIITSGEILTGSGLQLATFSGGSSIFGISSGVVLTTGDAAFAATSNTGNPGDELQITATGISDSDLAALGGFFPSVLKSSAALEFDFVATGNLVEFQYVFASDEYLNYAPTPCPDHYGNTCQPSTYNDLFGFFISGPGISGPFSGGAVNIATVPSTGDYVGVKTVNPCFNSSYFNDNDCTTSRPICLPDCSHPGEPWPGFAYDGFTDVMVAKRTIQCTPGATYHLKIAISNVGDDQFDAAVFLKANSLTSNFSLPPIIASPATVCEGQPFNLTISANSAWNYEWSTGQSGTGLTNITPTANLGTNNYTVTVTNSDGCQLTQSVNVNVHSNSNVPPYVNGVDNTGIYDLFVQAGEEICFSIPTFDALNEATNISYLSGISGLEVSPPTGGTHETGNYCWETSVSDVGLHSFQVKVCDENVCDSICKIYTFNINVACEFCPVDIKYENRSQSTIPLPAESKVARYIYAGTSVDPAQSDGPVIVSASETVDFRAGLNIFLEPGFNALPGSNFTAFIEPGTCIQDCEDCCVDWGGFTINTPLPNFFEPDGDGSNDFWYISDIENPYCAFSAQSFELHIFNRWGNEVYTLTQTEEFSCCPFKSPSPENPYPFGDGQRRSSIYWNGLDAGGSPVSDGPFFYVLYLWGCDNFIDFSGSITIFNELSVAQQQSLNPETVVLPDGQLNENQAAENKKTQAAEINIGLTPNPAHDNFYLTAVTNEGAKLLEQVQVLNNMGAVVLEVANYSNGQGINIESLSRGVYWVKIKTGNEVFLKTLIKQ